MRIVTKREKPEPCSLAHPIMYLTIIVCVLQPLVVSAASLIYFPCNGGYGVILQSTHAVINKKLPFYAVSQGYLYKDKLVSFQQHNLYETNIITGQSNMLLDVTNHIDADYNPWRIGYVDEDYIMFSAHYYDRNLPINKQPRKYTFYIIDRRSLTASKMAINDALSEEFSALSLTKIYYVNEHKDIVEFDGVRQSSLGVKGIDPSISPDGSKLAYNGSLLFGRGIYIYMTLKETSDQG